MALDPRERMPAGGAAGAAATAALREELRTSQAETAAAVAEARRLGAALAKVADQPKAALAERVAGLELRLARAERERTEVEEALAAAFTGVIRSLEAQIAALQREGAAMRAELAGRASAPGVAGAERGAGGWRARGSAAGPSADCVADRGAPHGAGPHSLGAPHDGERRSHGGRGGLLGILPTFARKPR